jgi:flavin-dependent dehydrogenase
MFLVRESAITCADPDVLVVGAGPAGSIAALVLARAGVRVRMIDRARFPRHKLCGDTLNPGSLAMLDRLGVSDAIRSRALPVTGMTVTGPGGARIVGTYGRGIGGLAITRCELDRLLLDEAIRAGARFDPDVVVRAPVLSSDGKRVVGVRVATGAQRHDMRARMVIAADGRASRLAFNLGLAQFAPYPRRWAFGTYYTDAEGVTSCGEMHIRPDGYIGVAQLPDGLTNVCVVRELQSIVRPQRLEVEQVIETALNVDSLLHERFVRARRVSDTTVLGPLAIDSRAAGVPGLLLAGDAAGFIDPMTGDGLRFAIRGAELAADAALGELATGVPGHESLFIERRHEFGRKWRLNRVLRRLVGSPRGVALAATVASRWGAPVRRVIAAAGDVTVARQLQEIA